MNGYREPDSPIVSEKPSNKTGDNKPGAEKAEKRGLAERNPSKQNRNKLRAEYSFQMNWIGYGYAAGTHTRQYSKQETSELAVHVTPAA